MAVVSTLFSMVLALSAHSGESESGEPRNAITIRASAEAAELAEQLVAAFHARIGEKVFRVEVGPSSTNMELFLSKKAAMLASGTRPSAEDLDRARLKLGSSICTVPYAMTAVVFWMPSSRPELVLNFEQVRGVLTSRIARWSELSQPGDLIRLQAVGDEPDSFSAAMSRLYPNLACTKPSRSHPDHESLFSSLSEGPGRLAVAGLRSTGDAKPASIRVSDSTPPIAPTRQTVRAREYPLVHYVCWFVPLNAAGRLRELVTFSVGPEGQSIVAKSNAGVLPLPFRDGAPNSSAADSP